MSYWLATHRVDLHKKHGNFIGCRLKQNGSNTLEACSVNFKRMQKGDSVVICSRSSDLIFGIFKVSSDGFTIIDDPDWGSAYCFKVDLEFAREPKPSFKSFKNEFGEELDFVKDSNGWEGSSVGWVKEISKKDMGLFERYLRLPV